MQSISTRSTWSLVIVAAILCLGLVWYELSPNADWMIAIHMGAHDNTVVISKGPKIKLVLELERIFGVRYFEKSYNKETFETQWSQAMEEAKKVVAPGLEGHIPFHTAIMVSTYNERLKPWMMLSLKTLVHAEHWLEQPHEESHAIHAFYDSAYSSALIITADADEHDGTFNIWWGNQAQGVTLLEKRDLNIALPYEYVGAAMDEMNHGKQEPRCWSKEHPLHCNKYAGTLMGYSAMGKPDTEWVGKLRALFESKSTEEANGIMNTITPFPKDQESQRKIAASAQSLLEEYLIKNIARHTDKLESSSGIVLAGDLALNVKANSAVQRHFKRSTWVPSNPGDDGVAVGAIWKIHRPYGHQELQYMGLPVIDVQELPALQAKYGGKTVTVQEVADTLLKENIVGLMRGRQEVGPRALGHRSLFAIPTSQRMKDRLNKIKARQWFRPVAPTMNMEAVPYVFEDTGIYSPYMSFAPRLKPGIEKQFPSIYHYDGSARPQTVIHSANPWLHELLGLIGKQIGQPIVINTSFNTKGKPIINSVKEAIELVKQLEELDYILVEDVLFSRSEVLKVKD